METSAAERRRVISDLLRSSPIASQDELADRLSAQGHAVTQATISRDLEHLGAAKVRRDGRLTYVLADEPRPAAAARLDRLLQQWVTSIDTAMNLLVIRTPPGSAHLIGVALDQSDLPAKVGTICGDDTIFVACRSVDDAEDLARTLRAAAA